jgi:tetratricopeptide (TPR) repeat protein
MDGFKRAYQNRRATDLNLPTESSEILEDEAWIAYSRGQLEEAINGMQKAIKVDDFNIDELGVPAHELLGDLLKEAHKYAPALASYQASLRDSPNRFNSLAGAADAARLEGHSTLAKEYLQKLVAIAAPLSERLALTEGRKSQSDTPSVPAQ